MEEELMGSGEGRRGEKGAVVFYFMAVIGAVKFIKF
jgi:hypothetical protein